MFTFMHLLCIACALTIKISQRRISLFEIVVRSWCEHTSLKVWLNIRKCLMPIESYPSQFKVLIFKFIGNMAHTFLWSFLPPFYLVLIAYWKIMYAIAALATICKWVFERVRISLKLVQTCILVVSLFEVWT